IEFIGAMSVSRSADVQVFRDVRDEFLATTQAGRGWISLFERIQRPVLGAVLADESLSREAISLLERARELLENEEAIASTRDVERGLAFLDSLAERETLAGQRRDLATVRKQLKKADGKSVRAILKDFLRPRRRRVRKRTR
ncbi:MAG: hypothetical protein DMF37_07455, partial [Verrucomicrobia bacterium]